MFVDKKYFQRKTHDVHSGMFGEPQSKSERVGIASDWSSSTERSYTLEIMYNGVKMKTAIPFSEFDQCIMEFNYLFRCVGDAWAEDAEFGLPSISVSGRDLITNTQIWNIDPGTHIESARLSATYDYLLLRVATQFRTREGIINAYCILCVERRAVPVRYVSVDQPHSKYVHMSYPPKAGLACASCLCHTSLVYELHGVQQCCTCAMQLVVPCKVMCHRMLEHPHQPGVYPSAQERIPNTAFRGYSFERGIPST